MFFYRKKNSRNQLNHFLENMEINLSDLNEINCANRNIEKSHKLERKIAL